LGDMNKRNVFVVIPAYNEAAHIGKVVRGLPRTLTIGKETFKVRVVVVDDCSRDNTHGEAKKAGATVLRHVINSGAGAATRTGLRYAEQNSQDLAYVVTIDADGQHSNKDVERIVRYAVENNAEMVVGNRLHDGNKQDMPWHRTLGNRGLSLISRVLFGIKIEDTQSGLRLYKASAVPAISCYTIDRYGFCTEMLWLAVRSGIDVREMPISVKYSKETVANGQSNWGVIDLVMDLLWIRISR
jgi:glycosyltransferase involved in cell wall biosynthesis